MPLIPVETNGGKIENQNYQISRKVGSQKPIKRITTSLNFLYHFPMLYQLLKNIYYLSHI